MQLQSNKFLLACLSPSVHIIVGHREIWTNHAIGFRKSSATIIRVDQKQRHYAEEHLLAYPVEYIAGIDLYNAGEFHAAHDAWEERWMGPVAPDEKLFLQAMIQSAVAFHHLQIGRPGAARRMYLMAKEKFARLNQRVFMSLDLDDYQAQLDRALSWLLSVADPRTIEPPQFAPPNIRLIAISEPGISSVAGNHRY